LSASYHHRLAISASPLSREEILYSLRVPSLIIHGLLDPFFPIEHAYALQKVLSGSTLKIIETMGHLFHEAFIEDILEAVLCHLRKYDV
jgi:predicted esterase